MWNEALGLLKFIASFASRAKSERGERERLLQRVDALTDAVQFLLGNERQRRHEEELRRKDDEQRRTNQAHEQEKLVLRLKLILMDFERRLPPPAPGTLPPSLDQD